MSRFVIRTEWARSQDTGHGTQYLDQGPGFMTKDLGPRIQIQYLRPVNNV